MGTKLRRDWEQALSKLEKEGRCRVCKSEQFLQAAHTIGRSKQDMMQDIIGVDVVRVKADSVVPLCQECHSQYDARELDLLPYLTLWEQMDAVEAAGGIEAAKKRLCGREL